MQDIWVPHLKGNIDTLEQINCRAACLVYNRGWREQGELHSVRNNDSTHHALQDFSWTGYPPTPPMSLNLKEKLVEMRENTE